MSKRPAETGTSNGFLTSPSTALLKRSKPNEDTNTQSLVIAQDAKGKGLIQSIQRTSGLKAPIMVLSGHKVRFVAVVCKADIEGIIQDEVLDVRFDPTGQFIGSASRDRAIRKPLLIDIKVIYKEKDDSLVEYLWRV